MTAEVSDLAVAKTELENLQAEISAQKSILESKQEAIDSLEVFLPYIKKRGKTNLNNFKQEELKHKNSENASILKSKDELTSKYTKIESELSALTESSERLNSAKQVGDI